MSPHRHRLAVGASWRSVRDHVERPSRLVVIAVASLVSSLAEAGALVLLTVAATSTLSDQSSGLLSDLGPGKALALAAVLLVVRALTLLLSVRLSARLAGDALSSVRDRFLASYLHAGGDGRSAMKLGGLQDAVGARGDNVVASITGIAGVITSAVSVLAYAVVALLADARAFVIAAVFGALLVTAFRPLTRANKRLAHDYITRAVDISTSMTDLAVAEREIAVFGVERSIIDEQHRTIDAASSSFTRSRTVMLLIPQLFQTMILGAAVGAVAIVLVVADRESVAAIGVVVLLLVRLMSAVQQLVGSATTIGALLPYVELLDQDLAELEATRVGAGTRVANRLGDLRFDSVTYAYPGGADVLHGISTTIGEREAVGIVGPSGAGKTTLLDLLLRMRRPIDGVLRDGTGDDVNGIRPEDWARLVAYVPQAPVMVPGTIADNVRFYRDFSDEDIERALALAHLDGEVADLPDGIHTALGAGESGLSGGQEQRLAIARALVGRPELLVLDEPTSALDGVSEARIRRTLSDLRGEMTMVIVAHRLSTLNFCTRLIALVDGRIETEGDPAQVRSRSAFLARAIQDGGIPA